MPNKPEINRENLRWLLTQPAEVKLAMLESHLDICRLLVNEVLEEEVAALCGARYSHEKPHEGRYSRWGYNPGSVRIGDHRLTIQVPRVFDNQTQSVKPLESYERLRGIVVDDEYLMRGIMLGLSVRDFADLNSNPRAKALSKSSVDQAFIERSAEQLKEFEQRRFNDINFVALFVDGKYLVGEQIVLVLGVTEQGVKLPLGFVQATSEHHQPCSDLFKDLIRRGLQVDQGLLCILDGSKGFHKAVTSTFGARALIQRCQWHKRENVISYLARERQSHIKRQLNSAWALIDHQQARTTLELLAQEIERENRSAANSLREGLEETLTLHRIGMTEFIRVFGTTNCIENLNSLLEKTTRNVKRWTNSIQRHRWVAAGLLEAEHRMRKVDNYGRLSALQRAVSAATREQNFN
jgi:transposase-like protein